jgi:Ca2+-binding EF-hand superfamily protein
MFYYFATTRAGLITTITITMTRINENEKIVNLFQRAQYRQDLTLSISNALSFAAIGADDAESEAVADLIEESASDENIFVVENLDFIDEKTGNRKFIDAYGSLNVVSSRCNPAYLKSSSARGRKRISSALARIKPQSGEKLRYIVLTQPDMFGFDFDGGYELLSGTNVRLKNHPFFKANFRGGVTTDEFTLGAENTHFHFHTNILGYTKWIDFDELRRVLTDCMQKTARDMGRELVFNTIDGLANIYIKDVKPKVHNSTKEITLADAVRETVKYVVKGSDFAQIPAQFICQAEKSLFGKRLVETFGEANSRTGKAKRNIGIFMALFASVSNDLLSPLFLVLVKAVTKRQYLDKNSTIQDSTNCGTKRETMRQYGTRLIKSGKREFWKSEIKRIFYERAEFRKIKLAQRYKYAIFCTLSGAIWRGICVSDEQFYDYKVAAYGESAFV